MIKFGVSREQTIDLDDHAFQSQRCTDKKKEFEINFCFIHYHVHSMYVSFMNASIIHERAIEPKRMIEAQ